VSVLQFLIGVKKAKLWFDALQLNYSFQFLIGTIKTRWRGWNGEKEVWFQFLIGTIKTREISDMLLSHRAVSIPYRYYKNAQNYPSTSDWNQVSIPYRYYKNSIF